MPELFWVKKVAKERGISLQQALTVCRQILLAKYQTEVK